MNGAGAQRVILGAWLGMIVLATVRRLTDPTRPGLPAPSVFLGISVLFTMLYGAGALAPGLTAAVAVGVDVGALLSPYAKSNPRLSPLATLAGYLDGLTGSGPPLPATSSQASAGTLAPGQPS